MAKQPSCLLQFLANGTNLQGKFTYPKRRITHTRSKYPRIGYGQNSEISHYKFNTDTQRQRTPVQRKFECFASPTFRITEWIGCGFPAVKSNMQRRRNIYY